MLTTHERQKLADFIMLEKAEQKVAFDAAQRSPLTSGPMVRAMREVMRLLWG